MAEASDAKKYSILLSSPSGPKSVVDWLRWIPPTADGVGAESGLTSTHQRATNDTYEKYYIMRLINIDERWKHGTYTQQVYGK